jgi:hypothetical protein
MRQAIRNISIAGSILICAILFFGCRTPTPPPTSQFRDDWTGLFLAVTKSFGTHTYYIGSDDRWSYFRTKHEESLFTPTYRKVETSQMKLRRTFPFCQGKPYRIQLSDFGYSTNRAPNNMLEPTATAPSVSTNK